MVEAEARPGHGRAEAAPSMGGRIGGRVVGAAASGGGSGRLAFPLGIPDDVSFGTIPDVLPSPAAGDFPGKRYCMVAFRMS